MRSFSGGSTKSVLLDGFMFNVLMKLCLGDDNGLVKKSARWLFVSIHSSLITPSLMYSRTLWIRTSMCLDVVVRKQS